MKVLESYDLSTEQRVSLLELWNTEYPEKLNYTTEDFEKYLHGLQDKKHYLLQNENNEITGWAFTFQRESEKWFAIILNSSIHGMGYGKMLLDKIRETESGLSAWVIDNENSLKANGEMYRSPLGFYLKNNFNLIPHLRLETEKISAVKIRWENQ